MKSGAAESLAAALRQAYTLLISAEPTLIRDAESGPNEVSLHYKALLRDKVTEWLDPMRDDFDGWLAALLDSHATVTPALDPRLAALLDAGKAWNKAQDIKALAYAEQALRDALAAYEETP